MADEITPVEETAPAAVVTDSAPVEQAEGIETPEVVEPVETAEEAKKRKQDEIQKRIDEITREKYEARRERDQERAERQRLQEFLTAQQAPKEQEAPPTLEACGWDDEKHRIEVAKWAVKQEMKAAQAEQQKYQQQYQQQEQRQVFKQAVESVNDKGRKEFADYDSVVLNNPAIVVTETMAAVMAQTENGQKVAYWLGNNPGEAHRIASLPDVLQGVEIGRLEARLASVTKKPTAAPPPIKPVGSQGAVTKDPENMTTAEWVKWRNETTKLK